MTVHVLIVDPPGAGHRHAELARTSPLDTDASVALRTAMLEDTIRTVGESGGDLLINYPTPEAASDPPRAETSPESTLRDLAAAAHPRIRDVRFEPQVGSSFAARAGNAATHLLREEDAESVAILDGTAPTLARTDLDGAAMKLRRAGVVIGPAPAGRVTYLGLADPIDFEGAYEPPELQTLTDRGATAGTSVDFLAMHPRVEDGTDLVTLVSWITARRRADRIVPPSTADCIDRLGIRVEVTEEGRRIVR